MKQLNVLEAFIAASNVPEPVVVESIRIRKIFRIKLPDAIIAATSMVFELTLITHNTVDFKKIPGLKLIHSHEII